MCVLHIHIYVYINIHIYIELYINVKPNFICFHVYIDINIPCICIVSSSTTLHECFYTT